MDIDFESYIRGSEPDKKEKASAWKTAIGLQAVDGLQTSDYLKDTAIKHLRSIGFVCRQLLVLSQCAGSCEL